MDKQARWTLQRLNRASALLTMMGRYRRLSNESVSELHVALACIAQIEDEILRVEKMEIYIDACGVIQKHRANEDIIIDENTEIDVCITNDVWIINATRNGLLEI